MKLPSALWVVVLAAVVRVAHADDPCESLDILSGQIAARLDTHVGEIRAGGAFLVKHVTTSDVSSFNEVAWNLRGRNVFSEAFTAGSRDQGWVEIAPLSGALIGLSVTSVQGNSRVCAAHVALEGSSFVSRRSAGAKSSSPAAAPNQAAQAAPGYTLPVPLTGRVWGYFDPDYLRDEERQHVGLDLPAGKGDAVVSPVTGMVITDKTGDPDIMQAYMVIREDGSGIEHVLGHVRSAVDLVRVERGEPVATVRDWGERSHVHWGANRRGVAQAIKDNWGWGRAPAGATRANAESRGWLDLTPFLSTASAPTALPPAASAVTAAVAPTPPSIERVAGGLRLNGLNCALLPAKGTERLPNLGAVVTGTNSRLATVGRVATLNPFGAVTVGGRDSGLPAGSWQHTGVDIPSNGVAMKIHAADNGVVVFSSLDVARQSDLDCSSELADKPAICTFVARGGLVVIKHLVAKDGDVLTVPAYKCPGNDPARICHDELSTGEVITYYLHLHPQTITVHTGDQVMAGQLIGHTYTDAEKKELRLAYPPHLHFEVWRDCSTIERNGYEPEGAGFRQTVGRPLLDPLYVERHRYNALLGSIPKDSKGFAALRLGAARAIAPLTPTIGAPGTDVRLAPTPRTTNLEIWRGTSANDFAIRPLRRVQSVLFDSIAELTYQGRSFDPSLTVDESSPGVWISWPDGSSRAVVIAWDNDGANATYLVDMGARQARQLQPGFFPREVYWSSDLHTALLIGPTGEGRLMGAINVSTSKTLTKDISAWQLQTLRWLDANRVALVGTEYDFDCSADPGGRCLGLKNPRPLLRIEDIRTWEPVP